jgi:hypothetical protein
MSDRFGGAGIFAVEEIPIKAAKATKAIAPPRIIATWCRWSLLKSGTVISIATRSMKTSC